jgi:isopenicillin-N epimerase
MRMFDFGRKFGMNGNQLLDRRSSRRSLLRNIAASGLVPWVLPAVESAAGASRPPAAPDDEAQWAQLRAQFVFAPQHIYFNNASLGAPPLPVLDAVAAGYRNFAANPTAAKAEYFAYLETAVRPSVARLLGADAGEIVLTRGASEGLYLVANGMELQSGDEIVTTTHEHPGGLTPWLVRAERSGVVVRQVAIPSPITSPEQTVETLSRELGPRTRVLFFCHVTRGGLMYPVKELCALARSKGIVSAVDGAQAVGALQVDVRALGCDLYATSLHKWTLAPAGNGALYVRADMRPRFRSLFKTADTDRALAGYYDMLGTYQFPVRAATAAALEFIEHAGGIRAIEQRNRTLSDYLKEELLKVSGVRLISSRSAQVSSPAITLFECAGRKSVDVERILLDRYRIHVDDHVRDGHDALRVSTHFYNSKPEIDRLIAALRE